MKLSQRGEGRASIVFGIIVLAVALYTASKVVPVMIRVYTFEDRVKEECKFLHGRSDEALVKDLVNVAKLEELDVDKKNIDINRVRTENYWILRVKINYMVPIVTPVRVFEWNRAVDYEAPMFE
jgi:hypothetical protein